MGMQEFPMEFMDDHGSWFDKTVTLQQEEDSEIHRVKIGGNLLWALDSSGEIFYSRTTLALSRLLFLRWLRGHGSWYKSTS